MLDHVETCPAYIRIRKGWEQCDEKGPWPGDGDGSVAVIPYRSIVSVEMCKRTEIGILTAMRMYTIRTSNARASAYLLDMIEAGISKSCGVPGWQA